MRAAAALALALAGSLLSQGARAGTVEGTVPLAAEDRAIQDRSRPSPYVGRVGPAPPAASMTAADTCYGAAWVADLPSETAARLERGEEAGPVARMDQIGQRFVPRVLAIVAGQTVEFRNSDNVYHNIFSYSPPKKFDLGRYPKGKSRSVTFAKPGFVQVYCDIHSDMRADILVLPTRRFAPIGPSGRFRIEGVPPGTHRVKVWLPSGEKVATVEVPAKGVAHVAALAP